MALTLNKQTVNFVLDQGATFEKTITAKIQLVVMLQFPLELPHQN